VRRDCEFDLLLAEGRASGSQIVAGWQRKFGDGDEGFHGEIAALAVQVNGLLLASGSTFWIFFLLCMRHTCQSMLM
jgi:hypothetical protein